MTRPDSLLALLDLVERVDVGALGLSAALEELMPQVAEHFGAEFASVLALDPDTKELHFEYGMGAPLEELRRIRLRLGEGIAGAVALGRRSSCIGDVAPVPQHSKTVDSLTGHRTHSLLAVPLIWSDEVVGVLELVNRVASPQVFSANDTAEARAIAGTLAAWVAEHGEAGLPGTAKRGAAPKSAKRSATDSSLPEGPLLVGTHHSIREILDLVLRVAPTDDPILVLGESGTGKELIARRLHHSSRRAAKPLVVLNCAALTETLLESSLFGHVRGAFTDAREDRAGAFDQANGGTLFLDEVGEMSPSCQAKLLRALESGEITSVGASEPHRVDVRLVAATNRDLAEEVQASRFRLDLYYRLRGIEIQLPPLRERSEDIPLLAELFMRQAAERKGRTIRGFSPETLDLLSRAPWPGNVRELRHVIESMVTLARSEMLTPNDIPPAARRDLQATSPMVGTHGNEVATSGHADDQERTLILETLTRTRYPASGRWNIARAARELDMSRKTLEYKIKRVHGLTPPSHP